MANPVANPRRTRPMISMARWWPNAVSATPNMERNPARISVGLLPWRLVIYDDRKLDIKPAMYMDDVKA